MWASRERIVLRCLYQWPHVGVGLPEYKGFLRNSLLVRPTVRHIPEDRGTGEQTDEAEPQATGVELNHR